MTCRTLGSSSWTTRDIRAHGGFVGFEDFNRRVRLPLGFRVRHPARELVFRTPSGRAESSVAPLPEIDREAGTLSLATMRSHDQWNTTIYSDNDRYRGVRNLRALIFMNAGYMPESKVLCAVGDFSTQSDQPIMKDPKVTVRRHGLAPESDHG